MSRIKAKRIKGGANFHLTYDVAITHLSFGREFIKAIKSKQVVSQEAKQKQYLVQQVKQDRITRMNPGEGRTEAACGGTADQRDEGDRGKLGKGDAENRKDDFTCNVGRGWRIGSTCEGMDSAGLVIQ